MKAKCTLCKAQILKTTAASTNGLCMPCFKSRNHGRTPANLKYIEECGLSSIEHMWRKNYGKFPKGFSGKSVAGICLTLLDSDVVGCVSSALYMKSTDAILDDNRISILQTKIPELEIIAKNTSDSAKEYFEELLWMAREILIKCNWA
jgi:hypothetical protein